MPGPVALRRETELRHFIQPTTCDNANMMNAPTFWSNRPLPLLSTREAHWLFAPGSLTERLMRLGDYSLERLDQREVSSSPTDAMLLGIRPGTPVWARSVLMRIDDRPCVTARSIAPVGALDDAWASLAGYGDLPLGKILYDDPAIVRTPFECALLGADEPLDAISRRYRCTSTPLRARRSTFIRNGSPLLVSECFLPEFWLSFADAALLRA
jgi:chorismate lyase